MPLVFCLCEKKNYETYLLIIQVLKTALHNRQLDFEPMYWMSDYEAALTKAIKEEVNIHFMKNISLQSVLDQRLWLESDLQHLTIVSVVLVARYVLESLLN